MRTRFLTAVVVAGVLLTACNAATAPTPTPQSDLETAGIPDSQDITPVQNDDDKLVFEFTPLNNSGQTGTAIIEDNQDGKAVVTLTMSALSGTDFIEPQLAHIHAGTCAQTLMTPMEFSLESVQDGTSITPLSISTADLMDATTHLSIDLHKSTKESNLIVNCVDLK